MSQYTLLWQHFESLRFYFSGIVHHRNENSNIGTRGSILHFPGRLRMQIKRVFHFRLVLLNNFSFLRLPATLKDLFFYKGELAWIQYGGHVDGRDFENLARRCFSYGKRKFSGRSNEFYCVRGKNWLVANFNHFRKKSFQHWSDVPRAWKPWQGGKGIELSVTVISWLFGRTF